MAEFNILDCDVSSKDTIALSPYYIDFNIDRIVKEINLLWKEDVSKMYRYFPSSLEGQEYRKAIYKDICKEGMFDLLMTFRDAMKQRKKILSNKELTRSGLQKMVMSLSEIRIYVLAVEDLTKALAERTLSSEGMIELSKLVSAYAEGEAFQQLKQQCMKLRTAIDEIPIKLNYQDRFLNVSFEEVEGKYDDFLRGFSSPEREKQKSLRFFQRKNPLGESIEVTVFEEEILEILYKKQTELFNDLNQFVQAHENYAEQFILQFSEDIAFYLSFYLFEREMKEQGLYFSLAKDNDRQRLVADDLYDLALACQLIKRNELPVANDTHLEENENFFVLTGPNQGGKTTFARSLGQLVFFSKLGLPVPARRAEVPFYSRILTHFSVEESVETGKGKLAEELSRLAPMMEDCNQKNDFVVINELFTTAANYDACIMGKRVLDHFIGQNCHGIYVTHLQELSKEDSGIVSLRAMMDDQHKQNFKIIRSTDPALESSILLVEKHRLQYGQVLKRLKGEEV